MLSYLLFVSVQDRNVWRSYANKTQEAVWELELEYDYLEEEL